ncbi:signal peptidase complex subunit 2 [Bradysia coprophila]|uniref:signal peptidase complex subunit 2 n=1 Tax=Bradysia coprophila TaxID=38358 RepID=UPI00187DA683|nr:signal peptidase complex subunit 2 [Bradysia coprophila]
MSSKSKKDDKNSKETEEVKINKWDGSAVKHAIDDAVKSALLDRPNCAESFALVDGRLVICGLAVGIALVALAWDHLHPFPESRTVLIACVGSYFVLMGILTLYTTFKEKGIFAVAYQKDGSVTKTWQASSEMKKYDDQYTLILTLKDNKGIRAASITKSCASYIDNNGVVLENLIANEVGRLYNSLNAGKKDK